tara:strand:- start:1483 stop:1896 length:414 start_codon:yes stop_codon:yes gene_type:complete
MELGCPLDLAFPGVDKKKKEKKLKRKQVEEGVFNPPIPDNILPYSSEEENKVYSEVKGTEIDNNNVKISNEEYEAFKRYQLERYIRIKETGIQQQQNFTEGFSNVNDDFNDVLLFGLMGIFFLIFTDYIYKLGKRSY